MIFTSVTLSNLLSVSKIRIENQTEVLRMDPLESSRLIMDEYAGKILAAAYRKPKSAIELSKKYGIPIAICYRRIHKLEEAGFLEEADRVLTQEGKRVSVYEATLDNVHIVFEDGEFKIKMEKKNEYSESEEDWQKIDLIHSE